jgi:hypothetical protein
VVVEMGVQHDLIRRCSAANIAAAVQPIERRFFEMLLLASQPPVG